LQDSLNARWAPNELPPSDKYAKAFGLNVAQFRDAVSRTNGILSQSGRRACSSNQDCRTLNDGSVCSKRDGEIRGVCIPTWFGICHAWAPASIMEPEPKCPVTRNGVTFRPFDIKALLTLAWDGARAPTVFTGARYNGPENAAKDRFGRFTDAAYRDLNPGFLHMYMTNVLGRFGKSFVVDVTASAEVWNQPIRSYQVVQENVMSPRNAARRFFNSNTYPFNPQAKAVAYVKTKLAWIVEGGEDGALVGTPRMYAYTATKEYEYLLELDRASQIIGGEWVGQSMQDHPDFAWFPGQRPKLDTVTSVGLSYRNVRELLDESIRGRC
ncbi:the Gp42 Transglutaminase from phytophthora Sojae, partial [Catenaria anguillulae PL171]